MRYFHGGVRDLEVGDLVLPADETGAEGVHRLLLESDAAYRQSLTERPELYRPDRVYLTDGPAAQASRLAGQFSAVLPVDARSGGDLYEVEPLGDVEDDEISDVVDLKSARHWCRSPRARVVKVWGRRAKRRHLTTAPVVALDFDGPLRRPGPVLRRSDPPAPGALPFVDELLRRGFRCVVVSSRAQNPASREAIEDWLNAHGFPEMLVTNAKVAAVAYVDDRAVAYQPDAGWSFDHALEQIEHLAEMPL